MLFHVKGEDGEAGDPGPVGEPGAAVSNVAYISLSWLIEPHSSFIFSFWIFQ